MNRSPSSIPGPPAQPISLGLPWHISTDTIVIEAPHVEELWRALPAENLSLDPDSENERDSPRARRSFHWIKDHRSGIITVAALMAIAGLAQGWNMYGAPQRIDDEGTYVAQAWSVSHWHTLAPYTYWYDHPPLGWILLSGWMALTHALDHAPSAVDAGRQAMLAAQLANVALLYMVARRLHLRKLPTSIGILLFSLSPLAIDFHREVLLDNLAIPLVLAAFALALSPKRHLAAQVSSGFLFGCAILSKETTLLLLPALVWQLWQNSDRRTRPYMLTLSGAFFALTSLSYVLYAALKGELLSGPDHVSLESGIKFQLVSRQASGSVLQHGTNAYTTVHAWLNFDPWFLGLAAVLIPLGLTIARLRPVTFAYSIMVIMLIRPGYLPYPFVVAMLPFAALVIAGAADWLIGTPISTASESTKFVSWVKKSAGPIALVLCVVVFSILAGGRWIRNDRTLFTADLDGPYVQAQSWIEHNVPHDDRLLIDDGLWLDLVRSGIPANQVVWFYKLGTDPRVDDRFPQGWRDFQYIIVSTTIRGAEASYPQVHDAIVHATAVETFGQGDESVVIMKINPGTATG